MWAIEHGLEPCILSFISNVCLKYAPKCMVSRLIFQKFSGEGLTEPPPQTPPPVFSRASPSVRASPSILGASRPRLGLRPRFSGASRPRFGLALNFRLGILVWPPKVNSWIRQCTEPHVDSVAITLLDLLVLFLDFTTSSTHRSPMQAENKRYVKKVGSRFVFDPIYVWSETRLGDCDAILISQTRCLCRRK